MGMGYQGYAKFYNGQGATDTVTVLTTGASVNLVLEPIYSQGVWGAGWYNAANSAHYADNAIRYEGNISTELQVGESGAYWNLIQDFAIAHRAYPKSLEISPDGSHVYKYMIRNTGDTGTSIGVNDPATYDRDANNYTRGAYCTSINFATSEGSVVTSEVGVIAIYREESDPASGTEYDNYSYIKQARGVIAGNTGNVQTLAPLNPNATNVNPIPYWRTNAKLFTTRGLSYRASEQGPQSVKELFGISNDSTGTHTPGEWIPQQGLETVEWNVDVSNNQQILYTCCGSRLPRAILMGPMDVTGAVTLYHNSGVFDPVTGPKGRWVNSTTPYSIETPFMTAMDTWFNVEIAIDNEKKVFITVPAAVVESDDYSIQSADAITNRAFNIKGLGGRCIKSDTIGDFVLPPCVMSRYTGASVDDAEDDELIAVPWTYNGSSYTYNPDGYEAADATE